MVRQKLDEARKEEEILQARFEEARTEAISLTGQLAQIEMLERDVKRLGDMNDVLLNQIASLDLKQNGQDVRVAVIEEPVVATSPVSPQLRLVALLTILGGLGTSLGLVTLLDVLDDRFRSVEEMQSRLGLPLLTMVQRLEAPESVGLQALVTYAVPTSTASESFRTLRTALTLTHPDARQIVVTSAEPGDGKTTTLANLAVCYAQAGKRTLLIDADLRRPGLTGLMDMRGPHGLSEVLRSDLDIAQMAAVHVRSSGMAGLDVLPSGPRPSDPAELLSSLRLSQLLAWAETVYDLILIDSPPTLATTDTAIIGRLVDGVILVVQPVKNRRRLVTRVVERLNLMKIAVLGLVVNRTGSEDDHDYYGYHSYGYGYGSGYEYGYGENADDNNRGESPTAHDGAADQGCVPFAKGGGQDLDGEGGSREPLIPPTCGVTHHGGPDHATTIAATQNRLLAASPAPVDDGGAGAGAGWHLLSKLLAAIRRRPIERRTGVLPRHRRLGVAGGTWLVRGLTGVPRLEPLGQLLRLAGPLAGGHRRAADDSDDPIPSGPGACHPPRRGLIGLGYDDLRSRRRRSLLRGVRETRWSLFRSADEVRVLIAGAGDMGAADVADDPPHRPAALSSRRFYRRQSEPGGNADRRRTGGRGLRRHAAARRAPSGAANSGHARGICRTATPPADGRRPPRRLRGPRLAPLSPVDRRECDDPAAAGLDRRPVATPGGAVGHRGHPPMDRRSGDHGHRQRRQHRLRNLPPVVAVCPGAPGGGRSRGDGPILFGTRIAAAGRRKTDQRLHRRRARRGRACAAS